MRITRQLSIAALVLVLASACGGGGGPTGVGGNGGGTPGPTGGTGGGGSTSNSITVADNSFTPSSTTVPRGTTVTWTWNAQVDHNVTFADGESSGSKSSGSYSRTFGTAGSFGYRCTLHAGMTGTVVVQ
jgi:plastocyanin